MKIRTVLTVILCLLAVIAVAQEKPPISIPVYPGAQAVMEVNMTNEELLSLLPVFASGAAKQLEGISEEDISSVLKDVKQVEYMQMECSKKGISIAKLTAFYNQKIPDGKWNRVFYSKAADGQVVAVYAQENVNELYGYRMRAVKIDGKMVNKMDVARITGKIDFEKLLSIAGPLIAKQNLAKVKS